MIGESVLPTSMRQRATGEIRGALPYGQVEPFDERSVERPRVFRVGQRFLEPARSADDRLSLDFHDPVVPSRLEHQSIQTRGTEDLTDYTSVVFETVGDDQWSTGRVDAVACVTQDSASVSVASSSDKSSRPQSGRNIDGRKDPDRAILAPVDRSDLVGLKLGDDGDGVGSRACPASSRKSFRRMCSGSVDVCRTLSCRSRGGCLPRSWSRRAAWRLHFSGSCGWN